MSQRSSFEQLRSEQDELRAQAGYLKRAQARRALVLPRARVKPARTARWSIAAAVLAAAAVVALWLARPWSPEPLSFTFGSERGYAGAFVAAPAERELPLRFADGTSFALAAGSSARVVSMDRQGAHLVIEKGRAVAAVVHRPDSHWRVDVGPFQVAVVGTRFDVSWDVGARVLELRLVEGAVRVSGGLLSEALEVRAGQRLRAFADDARVELSGPDGAARPEPAPASSDSPPEAASDAASPVTSLPAPAPSTTAALPMWRSLAAAGKFREALAAAERAGFDAECRRASGADLLALADAARLSGSAARAEQAYLAARGKLPGGGRASYGLGLVAFDQRGDFLRAARHFETYLREQPGGSLRAEATGRLMEAWQRAGRVSEARRVAEQYLARYPQGPQAARAKQLLQ